MARYMLEEEFELKGSHPREDLSMLKEFRKNQTVIKTLSS